MAKNKPPAYGRFRLCSDAYPNFNGKLFFGESRESTRASAVSASKGDIKALFPVPCRGPVDVVRLDLFLPG
jgi:hypothetical protein